MTQTTPAAPRSLTDPLREAIRQTYANLQANTPGFAVRRAQSQMIGVASRALATSGGVALVEAGTGVGKSLGYLTASVPVALATKKRLVLSTGTVALQSQLYDRDLPAFLKATGLSATTALLKGRARYFCPYKAGGAGAAAQDELFGDLGPVYDAPLSTSDQHVVNDLSAHFGSGKWGGDLDSPPVPVPPAIRPRITNTAAGCLGRRCPFVANCPALNARKTAQAAQVVVVNHALLLAALDMAQDMDEPLLGDPADMLVVVDEGHHLPSVAIETGAAALALSSATKRLVKLPPLLSRVFAAVKEVKLAGLAPEDVGQMVTSYSQELRTLKSEIELGWEPNPREAEPMWRAPNGLLPEGWASYCRSLYATARDLHKLIQAASSKLDKDTSMGEAERGKLMTALGHFEEQLDTQRHLWRNWSRPDAEGQAPHARWITLSKDGDIVCHCSPASASGLLKQMLWSQVDSAVVTSATISTGGDFTNIAAELGVPEGTEMVSLPSPFDLPNQAQLYVPRMHSQPQDRDAHTREVAQYLEKHLDLSAGSLVLFTSKAKMKAVFDALPATITASVLVQGQEPMPQMVKNHIKRIDKGLGSVIFGMQSTGEGLDLKGNYCSHVFITSLPFPVPTDPVLATLGEWLESRNINSFVNLSVPHAIRVLTQFAGRLIRTTHDTGTIHILDSRLLSKRYGSTILGALPPFGRVLGN